MTITVYAGYFEGSDGGNAKGLLRDIRIFWALYELDLPFDVKWFDVSKGEHKSPDYIAANPFGKVPVIRDEEADLNLFESAAIVKYLANKVEGDDRLVACDARGDAEIDQWLHFAKATLEPAVFGYFATVNFTPDAPGNEWRQERFADQAKGMLSTLDEILGQRKYLVGERFTVADLIMGCSLRYVIDTPYAKGFDNVAAYMARLYGRPAFERALAFHMSGPN